MEALPTPIKGYADWRSYKAIRLENGVTVVLVHDVNSKHFACANSVSVGASCDPRELSGLAHFTEHMCFLGSEEYPRENEYKQYLSKHGGRSNASTSLSHTTYQFEILAEDEVALKALDIFVHFFVNPLFTKSGTQREVQAVDSENSKNKSTDGRRRLQILKALADQNHHYSKFTTGDRHTLPAADVEDTAYGDEIPAQSNDPQLQRIIEEINNGGEKCTKRHEADLVREAVLAFHKRHYYPERMVAVLVGPQSLEQLETWAMERFSKVVDRRVGMSEDDGDDRMRMLATRLVDRSANDAPPVSILSSDVEYVPAFRADVQGTWPVLLTTKPLSDMRKLVVYFPVPPTYSTPDNSPTSMLSHLLGHEGVGSAYAFLQDAGLITSLSAGSRINAPDQNLFQVQISLTESGERNWADVVKVVFDYADMLCKASCSDDASDLTRIWDEVCRLNRMTFNQRSPGAAYSFAPSLAQSVSKFGTYRGLTAGFHLHEGAETLPMEKLYSFCKHIVPSNCFVERCSKNAWEEIEGSDSNSNSSSSGYFGLQTEKWYGVEFFLTPIDEKMTALWAEPNQNASHLSLPNPNQYIPRSLELCEDLPDEAKSPRIEKAIDPPVLLENGPEGRLWWRLDDRYALPKSSLTVLIRTTKAEHKLVRLDGGAAIYDFDSKSSQLSNLLTLVFQEATAQYTYDAHLAGLGFTLSKSSSGFSLTVSGYSDRLSTYAQELLIKFCSSDFIKKNHFTSSKDRTVRSLRSFHESKRADSIAMYYRDLLLSGKNQGVENSLATVEQISLDDIISHHHDVFSDCDSKLEVLYTGNVSQDHAVTMFDAAKNIVRAKRRNVEANGSSDANRSLVPGPLERRLPPGEDIEIHFQSRNVKEENGAVIVTFQSQVDGFKGKALSTEDSLKRSAAIRLISRIVKEPFFNELRTKQQLGYIVSSFYESGYTTRQAAYFASNPAAVPHSTSIDSLSMYVLSKKVKPTDIANRIDEFLVGFRDRLVDQSEEDLDKHASALARLLTKPTRKLNSEASSHMSKIRRFSPELFSSENENNAVNSMPWDSAQILARAVRGLKKEDIISVWDSLVVNSESAKITSLVYGAKYPLEPGLQGKPLTTMEGLLKKRSTLKPYGSCEPSQQGLKFLLRRKPALCYAVVGAAAAVTVGAVIMSKCGRLNNDQKTK